MDQLKNSNSTHQSSSSSSNTASSTIQSAIDELSNLQSNKNTTNTNTTTTNTTNTATAGSSTLNSIDSTLNALDNPYPFSTEHRARPHSSTLTPSTATNTKNTDLARTLGIHSTPAITNPLSPTGLAHPYNPLTHWGSVSSLRNPYPTYGAPRSATKTSTSNPKDANNPRKKSYEDKMDKQRLEHILFSGDQSGPLNQQKERMRQKLQKKQANKKGNHKAKHKKTQSLPNTTSANHGLLQLDAAKKQKANGDNGGYFLTEITSKSSTKTTINHANTQTNKKKKNRGNQRRGTQNQRKLKKKPKKQSQNTKQNQKKKKKAASPSVNKNANVNASKQKPSNTDADASSSINNNDEGIGSKLDECNEAFGEQSKQPNHSDYADQLPGDILNQQCDVFEQEPDEYFGTHDIRPIVQNKLKLEMNQQIQGISIWRDKKELQPLLSNGGYNEYHKNENPNLLSPNQDTLTDDDEDEDPFVDNFVNVGDSDNENEGDLIKNKSTLSSNSNDSDAMEIFIDPNDREIIRQNENDNDNDNDNDNENGDEYNGDRDHDHDIIDTEPGSIAANEYQYEGINSNVDLIKYEDSLRNNNITEDKPRRNSTLLNSSMTPIVDGGFDVNAEDEEKHIEAPKTQKQQEEQDEQLVFDAKGVDRVKEVQFVEEQSDPERDIFENMTINEEDKAGDKRNEDEEEVVHEGTKGEQLELNDAFSKVLKAAASKQNGNKEEEREKEADDTKGNGNVGQLAAKWVKIKNDVNEQQSQGEGLSRDKRNDKKNEKKNENKKNKKKKKNSSNDSSKMKKNKQMPKAEKKRKVKTRHKQQRGSVKDEEPNAVQSKTEEEKENVDKNGEIHGEKVNDHNGEKVEKKGTQTKTKPSQNQNQNQKKKEKEKTNDKKRKKRAKKKKSNKAKQKQIIETDQSEKTDESQKDGPRDVDQKGSENVSDDDTITVDSSSNAPSSTQDQNVDDAQDDGGWIIKGNKNKNNKNTKRSNRNTQNRNQNTLNQVSSPTTNYVSTPVSSKSSASRKSFGYTDSMEVKPKTETNDKHHKEKDKKKNKKHKDNHKKPQIKKSKSVNNTDHHNKSQNRLKNRKERRNNNRVNRQKSDPSILNKYPSSTIVVPHRHSKTICIQASMILPKSTNPATSDPLTKHNYPPLKSQMKKVHFADTSAMKRTCIGKAKQPNVPPVNLSVLSPSTHSISTPTSITSLKNEFVSTPHSIHSDSGCDIPRHPRPTRPPITRLNQPKKESNNNNTPPTTNPILASSNSENLINITPTQHTKPPLLAQRSAPLMTSSANNNNNMSPSTHLNMNMNMNMNGHDTTNDHNHNNHTMQHIQTANHAPMAPNTNHSLITSNGTNPTHMALYVDEKGTLHETPLTLPDIFPAGLPPTSIPNVLGSLPPVPINTTDTNHTIENGDNKGSPLSLSRLNNFTVPNVTGLPPPQSSTLTLTSFLPNLTGLPPLPGGVPNVTLPLTGVSPLNTIPHSIPILLPMPQFTAEQMANLNKLNMIPTTIPNAAPIPTATHTTNSNKSTTKTALQPIVASFKPMKSKSKKLEDIKEEDEEHETMDSAPNIEPQPSIEVSNDNTKDEETEDIEDERAKAALEHEHQDEEENEKQDDNEIDSVSHDTTTRTTDSSVNIRAHCEPKSDKECLETFKNDLIEDEIEDEWIEIADLDSTMYPATLWCLHVNKWSAHPQCSLKKLQQSMASALLSS